MKKILIKNSKKLVKLLPAAWNLLLGEIKKHKGHGFDSYKAIYQAKLIITKKNNRYNANIDWSKDVEDLCLKEKILPNSYEDNNKDI